MKRAILLLVFIILMGCQSDNTIEEINNHVETVKEYAEVNNDSEEYIPALEEFNEYLSSVGDGYKEYAEVQEEANNMRIEALENNDTDLITESSFKQAQALEILHDLES